ncbi:MAG: coproporphyrinogen III oxidase [Bacteroidia bacterium]|nr:MAG: coproporphyrinogen III oxidase [Bacteroidia bacterium]
MEASVSPLGPSGHPSEWALYVHFPFCRGKCPYCDFYSLPVRGGEVPPEYPELIVQEFKHLRGELDARGDFPSGCSPRFRTIYLGGGTPSLLPPPAIGRLLSQLGQSNDVTLECNPEGLDRAYFEGVRTAGVTRVSIGVQSLDDRVLRLLGRRHDGQRALHAIESARSAGVGDISVDLIYGIPGQPLQSLEESLRRLSRLEGVDHISAYHLTAEPNTAYGKRVAKGSVREVDEEVSMRHFRLVHDLLERAGFEHYEVSSFARHGRYARHNMAYWRGGKYLGLGPGAHSYDGGRRWWNAPDWPRYAKSIRSGLLPREMEELSDDNRLDEWIMTGLRTRWGLDLARGVEVFGRQAIDELRRRASSWIDRGIALEQEGYLKIHPRHFLISDALILDLAG